MTYSSNNVKVEVSRRIENTKKGKGGGRETEKGGRGGGSKSFFFLQQKNV
jgi:hypothetical protein